MLAFGYIIVMTWAATGSRLVRQLIHTGHYAAPPKRYIVEDRSQHSCSILWCYLASCLNNVVWREVTVVVVWVLP